MGHTGNEGMVQSPQWTPSNQHAVTMETCRVETAVAGGAGGEPEWRRRNEKQACRRLDGAGDAEAAAFRECSGFSFTRAPGRARRPGEKGSLF